MRDKLKKEKTLRENEDKESMRECLKKRIMNGNERENNERKRTKRK